MKNLIKLALVAAIAAAGTAACTTAPEQHGAPAPERHGAPTTQTPSSAPPPPPVVVTEVVTSTVTNPPKPRTVVQIDNRPGYGALKLGMTLEQSRTAGLRSLILTEDPDSCDANERAAISRKYGIERITLPEGAKTSAGIGVGSTVAEMKRIYPNVQAAIGGFIAELNNVSRYAFQVDSFADTGKVVRIKLMAAQVNCPNAAL